MLFDPCDSSDEEEDEENRRDLEEHRRLSFYEWGNDSDASYMSESYIDDSDEDEDVQHI